MTRRRPRCKGRRHSSRNAWQANTHLHKTAGQGCGCQMVYHSTLDGVPQPWSCDVGDAGQGEISVFQTVSLLYIYRKWMG